MLRLQDLHAYYGKSHILRGVNLSLGPGEIVCLLGRNGSGRSTALKASMGMVRAEGSVQFKGHEMLGLPTFDIARHGLGYVPEERDIFPTLSVHQNLLMGENRWSNRGGNSSYTTRWTHADTYAMFAQLKLRMHTEAGVLSGGEQQMLTLCRTLMGNPDLIMIDEPTEGLAPQVVALVAQCLKTLQSRGVSTLLVEQKLNLALEVSARCYVMGHGQVVFEGTPAALRADDYIYKEWLEI
jgi:branched-chain amino acid transport system ATP-binding protein